MILKHQLRQDFEAFFRANLGNKLLVFSIKQDVEVTFLKYDIFIWNL
jgi:hypothetical protein